VRRLASRERAGETPALPTETAKAARFDEPEPAATDATSKAGGLNPRYKFAFHSDVKGARLKRKSRRPLQRQINVRDKIKVALGV
jgi:hypothetical protein